MHIMIENTMIIKSIDWTSNQRDITTLALVFIGSSYSDDEFTCVDVT